MALFDLGRVRATIADLARELQSLRAERETLLQKREDLEAQPACKADMLALIDDLVDRKAQDFPRRLETGLSYFFRHPLSSLPADPKAATPPLKALTAVIDPNAMVTLEGFESSLFFVLRDPIKAGLRHAVEQLDFAGSGPPRVERIEMIAAIDTRIDEIDKQERELTEAAEASGLKL
jgi:hypothetical protein